jgi:hypothetical protein
MQRYSPAAGIPVRKVKGAAPARTGKGITKDPVRARSRHGDIDKAHLPVVIRGPERRHVKSKEVYPVHDKLGGEPIELSVLLPDKVHVGRPLHKQVEAGEAIEVAGKDAIGALAGEAGCGHNVPAGAEDWWGRRTGTGGNQIVPGRGPGSRANCVQRTVTCSRPPAPCTPETGTEGYATSTPSVH